MRCILCDLDGTLFDITHRLHHVQDGARNWNAFFAGISDDLIVEPVKEILLAFNEKSIPIVLCSGRPEKCRDITVSGLNQHKIPYRVLYMRPDNDTRPDHIVKKEILHTILNDGYEPFLVIDDRQSVVDMWRSNGLFCLQAAPSEPAIPPNATLTLMIGPSGGGKSTWLQSKFAMEYGIKHHHIISSDEVRADMLGDFRDQSRNAEVFAAVHAIALSRLRHGLPVVIDATHLRRRDRMAAAAIANGNPVRYVIVNRPMADKRRDAGWRNDVRRPNGEHFDLLAAHEQTFNSQIKEIIAGDNLLNVKVIDLRA